DDLSVTSNAGSQLDVRTYDLERVEVLRGPQGTLYGDGSVGGTIRYITRSPDLRAVGANVDVALHATEDGSPSERVGAMVNIPLLDDTLGIRVAGTYDHMGGWIDQPSAGKKDFNNQDLSDVRIKALWQPSPQLTVNAMVVIHRNSTSN